MDLENMNMWYWLITFLIAAIFGIIGYYFGKGRIENIDKSADLGTLRDKNSKLQSDLDACNELRLANTSSAANKSNSLVSMSKEAEIIVFDEIAAKSTFAKPIRENDLKVIEGIGPKIEEMFHVAGIKTWKTLSETSVAGCQDILKKGGERYKIHDPSSWPMQAKMCYTNKWKELIKWQNEHAHGKL
ncbi:hypothetical protein LCGC14_0869250 [marine sediment metagenome]|uniref:LSU ribosomal protein L21p n=2 Tax=root TaxID=1 RepID=A0A831QP26_9FLAO|nr:hypothetical protein [Pricia sp.]HEA20513.1 hypothetical protein [Pricia antarctica]